ncbi:MAG: hypothetical protein ACRELA_22615 [Candidatus Rokuibacteriota bacterium]
MGGSRTTPSPTRRPARRRHEPLALAVLLLVAALTGAGLSTGAATTADAQEETASDCPEATQDGPNEEARRHYNQGLDLAWDAIEHESHARDLRDQAQALEDQADELDAKGEKEQARQARQHAATKRQQAAEEERDGREASRDSRQAYEDGDAANEDPCGKGKADRDRRSKERDERRQRRAQGDRTRGTLEE